MFRKCLIEVELDVEDNGRIDIDKNLDVLNDIGKYFEPEHIKYIGEAVND